jgi:ATP-dependent Clp protease adaptor protein ClpS
LVEHELPKLGVAGSTPVTRSILPFVGAAPARLGPDEPDVKGAPGVDTKTKVETPKMFKCVFHNDDYTTMEFVVEVLMRIFRRTRVEATRIMLSVHQGGRGIAGVYTREIAETKATAAMDFARTRGYPLLVTTEPE